MKNGSCKKIYAGGAVVLGCLLLRATLFAQDQGDSDELSPEDAYYLGRAVAAAVLEIYRPWTERDELTYYLNLICQAIAINSPGLIPTMDTM